MFSFLSVVFVFILTYFYGIINGELALSVSHSLASSPKGGATGGPVHSELDAKSPIERKRAGLATEGSSFWTSAPCQAAAGLDSEALPFPGHRALLVQTKPDRPANGSPFGGAGERSETERASRLSQSRCTAISRLFVRAILSQCKSCLSASLPSPSPSVPPLPKGEALAGRATSYWTPEARQGAKGRALLQRAAASGQAHLVKLPLAWTAEHYRFRDIVLCSSRRNLTDLPMAPPLGELAGASPTERARPLTNSSDTAIVSL